MARRLPFPAREPYLLGCSDNKLIWKTICVLLKETAQDRNLILTPLVFETKKHDTAVWVIVHGRPSRRSPYRS